MRAAQVVWEPSGGAAATVARSSGAFGQDIDHTVCDYFIAEFKKSQGIDLSQEPPHPDFVGLVHLCLELGRSRSSLPNIWANLIIIWFGPTSVNWK